MKIVCISDTHGKESQMTESVPEGDILIFAGDATNVGELHQVQRFNEWSKQFAHPHKLFVAGNHDFSFENSHQKKEAKSLLTNWTYLEDSEVTISGVKVYGSPVQPWFHDWAFNRRRGADIKKYWNAIPDDVQILITHGPVEGILDIVEHPPGFHVGCEDLKNRILDLKQLKVHICGHIHCSHGMEVHNGVTYINASICTEQYVPSQSPIVFDI